MDIAFILLPGSQSLKQRKYQPNIYAVLNGMEVIMTSKKIAVIGLGHVGSAAAEFFGLRYEVVGYDSKNDGEYPKEDIDSCLMAVVCVPTPMSDDGSCNTYIVEEAISKIDTPLIMIKSTVAPGTTDRLKRETGKRIVFSPEYAGESKYNNPIYKSMRDIDFHIVGGAGDDVRYVFEILEKVAGPHCKYYNCSAVEAEVIKYMENSFLALKVTFVNEFYEIAKKFGADWHKVREGWLLDERIGRASTTVFADERGYGGKCLPKDTMAIITASETAGYSPEMLKSMVEINKRFANNNSRLFTAL
jgi:nucleotide sugar dehydrogenase